MMMPLGSSQALSRKLATPREDGDVSRSASPSQSPRQRPRRLPGGHFAPDSPEAPRQAWGNDGGPHSARPGGDRGSTATSRNAAGRNKPPRGGSVPANAPLPPEMSVEWHATTLFGGEKNSNPKAKRGFATTFRRPTSSRQKPHQRPIFVVGQDGADPRMCVDTNAPGRFGSAERTRYERSWHQARANLGDSSRLPEATIRNIGNSGPPSSGRASAPMGRPSFDGGRSGGTCTPNYRPSSVQGYGRPPPLSNSRPCSQQVQRPVSQQAARASWGSAPAAPPAPACWSGA